MVFEENFDPKIVILSARLHLIKWMQKALSGKMLPLIGKNWKEREKNISSDIQIHYYKRIKQIKQLSFGNARIV